MPMVVSNKKRIYYRYEGEKGAFLLLHHGLFGSHADWYDSGFVEALATEFRLIVPDARGHGRSDCPEAPDDYALQQLAADVIAIMDELDIRNLHFLGYSLGALVGFELLCRHPERLRITMLGGEAPYPTEPALTVWHDWRERIASEGLDAVRDAMRSEGLLATLRTEPSAEGHQAAALALLQHLDGLPPRPADTERVQPASPVTLFTAEHDPAAERIREARRSIHRARFVTLPGLQHHEVLTQRDALLEEVTRLLKSGRRQPREGAESTSPRGGRGRGGGRREHGPTEGNDEAPRRGRHGGGEGNDGNGQGRGRRRNGGNGSNGNAASSHEGREDGEPDEA